MTVRGEEIAFYVSGRNQEELHQTAESILRIYIQATKDENLDAFVQAIRIDVQTDDIEFHMLSGDILVEPIRFTARVTAEFY